MIEKRGISMDFQTAAVLVSEQYHRDTKKRLKDIVPIPAIIELLAALIPELIKLCPHKTPTQLIRYCSTRKNLAARTVKNKLHEDNKKFGAFLVTDDELARACVRTCAAAKVEEMESLRGQAMDHKSVGESDNPEVEGTDE